jgi:hypothetical protein
MAALGLLLVAAPGAARAQLGNWSTDANTGCKIWNMAPQPNETVTWTGSCSDGMAQGTGVLQWFESGRLGDRFEGSIRDGKPTGHGVVASADGTRYDGDFGDGTMNGHGELTLPNGDHYDGEWRNGRPNGVGRFVSAINGTYDGVWRDGCFKDGKKRVAVAVAASACR